MRVWKFALALVLFSPAGAVRGAQDDPELRKAAFALEKALEKIIEHNEASIACILVSRSDAYQEFGQGPERDRPGKLGRFDVRALDLNDRFARLSDADKKQWRKQLDFTDAAFLPRSFGSGVVVDADGLILTNYHVVQDAAKIYVRLPGGKSGYADIHAADARSDLAVLKLLNPGALPLKAIALGDADKLRRGHFVLTLSNPFAVGVRDGQPSASYGILSNIRRRALAAFKEEERIKPFQFYSTLLQTDTRMHQGSSGGALLNLSGEMVGLITSVAAIQGLETPGGFAIPVNAGMRRIINVLKRGEEIDYAFLGVGFKDRQGDGNPGVRLTVVGEGAPAEIEGKLKKDDILLEINDQPIHDSDDVYTTLGMHLAGAKIKLHARREMRVDNKFVVVDIRAEVTLAKLHVPGKSIASSLGSRPYVRGLRVDYSSLYAQQGLTARRVPPGVYVSDVKPNSVAERANLKAGEVITHVNGLAVTTPAAFYQAAAKAPGALDLTLYAFPPQDPPTIIRIK